MREERYKLEILWDNGELTEVSIGEKEKELIEKYGGLYILIRYYLEGEEEAKPISYQIWDKEDNPQIPIAEAMV